MFRLRLYFFLMSIVSFSMQAMQITKEDREPRKDNPILHLRSPEQTTRKQEKKQLNNLRNSQKALEQQTLTNAVKGQCSAQNVLQRLMDSE